jgi:hypothetical protein
MKIKTLISTIILIFLIQIGFAQEVEMITDRNEAKELAGKENKQILIILTGSEYFLIKQKSIESKLISHLLS